MRRRLPRRLGICSGEESRRKAVGRFEPLHRVDRRQRSMLHALQSCFELSEFQRRSLLASPIAAKEPRTVQNNAGKREATADDDEGEQVAKVAEHGSLWCECESAKRPARNHVFCSHSVSSMGGGMPREFAECRCDLCLERL